MTRVLAAVCGVTLCLLTVPGAPLARAADGRTVTSNEDRFVTPSPLYPSLVDGDTHEWAARVAFDGQGNATEALIIRSTGSAQLDNTITRWIRGHWRSRGGKPTTLVTSAR